MTATSDIRDDTFPDMLEPRCATLEERSADVDIIDDAADTGGLGCARIPCRLLAGPGPAELRRSTINLRCITRPDGEAPSAAELADATAVVARA